MTNLQIIQQLQSSTFHDEDGESYQLEFQPGLSPSQIEDLAQRFPEQYLDPELAEILQVTRGWDGYGPERVYFDAIGRFGNLELSAYSISLGQDGFGNQWLLELDAEGKLGKVFFDCHDPAVLVIHSQSLNQYLHHLLAYYQNPADNYLNTVHGQTVSIIWEQNKLCSPKASFLARHPEFRDFLGQFEGEEWTVADLRRGLNQDGFAWGKYGSNEFIRRHPNELIWVLPNKKKGFWANLFG